jgi:hypothetical protein
VNPGYPERKLPALLPKEARQRAPHVPIPDECQLHLEGESVYQFIQLRL